MGQCPSNFRGYASNCISECPSDTGFEFQSPNGQPRCVYKGRPEFFINLSPVDLVRYGLNKDPPQDLTVDSIKNINTGLYTQYKTEQDRVAAELAVILNKIGKENQIKDAFQKLQDAENARDQAPDAYQQARSSYYTLKDGESWKEREKERILKAEVDPLAQQFVDVKSKAIRQYESQRKTVDVVNGLKDNVLSLKDEMKYAADTFQQQLGKVKGAINQERRGRVTETKVSIWDWVDTILNFVIVASLLYVIYLLYKKFALRPVQPPAAVIIRG